jgi:hypothetical protein
MDRCYCMQVHVVDILLHDRMSDRPRPTVGFTSLLAELARTAINLGLSRDRKLYAEDMIPRGPDATSE